MDVPSQLQQQALWQCRAASRRFLEHSEDRQANLARREAGQPVIGTPAELEQRANRLMRAGEVVAESVIAAAQTETSRPKLLERVIGAAQDLLASSFLTRGARAAAGVARISLVDDGRELPLGTGFLVSPRLLMTNNHVLPDQDTAGRVELEFGAEMNVDNQPLTATRCRLDPATLFLTDTELDYTLVAVQVDADRPAPGASFGWSRLVAAQGKILVGEAVNIIGHPMGRRKEIAIRDNRLDVQLDRFLHYSTDTEPGNSGSPVFNDQWEVIALHHCGVARLDEQHQVLRRDGQVWHQGDADDQIDWIANEGARVSVILAHLRQQQVSADQRLLLAEMGPEAALGVAPAAVAPVAVAAPGGPGRQFEALHVGVAARPGALRGSHLVLLHGRSQQGKDPEELRRSWIAGLNQGLTLAGLGTLDPADAWFPFYGDRFADVVQGAEESLLTRVPAVETAADLMPAAPTTRALYETLVAQTAEAAGMPVGKAADESLEGLGGSLRGFAVARLQRQLSAIAARSGLDSFYIAQRLRDVAAYLDNEGVRQAVLDAVRQTLPDRGRMVIVSHSLGTVVALDLIAGLAPEVEVSLLVTAGSPLGLDAVYNRLRVGGPRRPARIGHWLNTWCPADAVAIGCPLRDDWGDQIEEIVADNPKDRAHSITEYLADPAVARTVAAALEPKA
ncbi:serine protease [Actinoplanes sp. N902-109]|uniref:trypsin-like serine peptidase n=1 Tax=Actinoplanes sp. (strain N902-109) TaxID=649831 RepID=UPI0003296240|nr:serine protease [Actinoplanes sp. N902-109]AGL20470.1 V8-like protein Glu-specific endopeptidase-like protein [Actinoplanes sp. N902-109]